MKRLIFLITAIFLFSCTGSNSNNSEDSNEQLDTSQLAEPTSKSEPETQVKTKTELDLLFEDGLMIANSSEQCASRRWVAEPRTKLVFEYPQGNKLILEEWERSFDRNDDELRLLDFHIFNCQTREVLLEVQYTTADYKIVDVKPNLKIQINADIPTLNEGYSRQPFIIKTFREVDSTIITDVEKIFDVPNLSSEEITKIETDYNSRPTLEEDKELQLGDFASDELLINLFRGAINGNQTANGLFENIEKKYALDGAIGELHGDLNYLLNEAENKHNNY